VFAGRTASGFSRGGGVDKRVLAGSKAGFREMVDWIAPVVREGGYLPCPDHCVPAELSWESFLFYEWLIGEFQARVRLGLRASRWRSG